MYTTAFLTCRPARSGRQGPTSRLQESISNRVLLLARLCEGPQAHDLLASDDTRVMSGEALRRTGLRHPAKRDTSTSRAWQVKLSVAAELFLGNAGTAMRRSPPRCGPFRHARRHL